MKGILRAIKNNKKEALIIGAVVMLFAISIAFGSHNVLACTDGCTCGAPPKPPC